MDDHENRTNEDIERLGSELAERVRALNNLTQASPGLTEPAAAYTVLGNLAQTSFRLVQTAEQIDVFLTRELDAGRLGHDQGDDPVSAVTSVHNALARAVEQAAELGDTFRRASSALAPIYAVEPGDELFLAPGAVAPSIDRETAQAGPADKDFPNPIGDVLSSPGATDPVSPEPSSSPQARHPRRER